MCDSSECIPSVGIAHSHYSYYNISTDAQTTLAHMLQFVAFLCETFVFAYLGLQASPVLRSGGAAAAWDARGCSPTCYFVSPFLRNDDTALWHACMCKRAFN